MKITIPQTATDNLTVTVEPAGDCSELPDTACSTNFKWSREDLKAIAGAKCLDIFKDIDESELGRFPKSVVGAWKVGRDLSNL